MKILIIDDAQDIVQIIKFVLTKQGHVVSVAQSGQEALAVAKNVEPDLLFVDYHLPDMEGPQVVASINQALNKNTKAVLVTGLCDDQLESKLSSMGFSALIAKPFTADIIKKVMEKFM